MQALILYVTCMIRHSLLNVSRFGHAAPVGNSNTYLNLKELTAGDSFSLMGNKILLTLSQPFSIGISVNLR